MANPGDARSTEWNARGQDTVITALSCTGSKGNYPTVVVDDDPIDWDARVDDVISKAFAHFERCRMLSDDSLRGDSKLKRANSARQVSDFGGAIGSNDALWRCTLK